MPPRIDKDMAKRIKANAKASSETKHITTEAIPEVHDDKADLESLAISGQDYDEQEKNRFRAETRTLVEKNLDSSANRRLRWKYATWVFYYLISYSIFVGILLLITGWKALGFELPEAVLSFLVGSTAASAIGLVYAVTHGLFSQS